MRRWLLQFISPHALEAIGLWLIMIGLLGEAALIFSWVPLWYEKPLSFVFTLMIAAGVWVENVGASAISNENDGQIAAAHAQAAGSAAMAADAGHRAARAFKQAAEANERAAQLENEAAQAKLELEKFRRPWELPVWKLKEYEMILNPFSGTPFTIHVIDNVDQRQMAATLMQAFSHAKWTPHSRSGERTLAPGVVDVPPWINGVDVRINDTHANQWRAAAQAVIQIFVLAEIEATVSETNGVQPDAIHIFIGRKT
jgi:hypothetical protein